MMQRFNRNVTELLTQCYVHVINGIVYLKIFEHVNLKIVKKDSTFMLLINYISIIYKIYIIKYFPLSI